MGRRTRRSSGLLGVLLLLVACRCRAGAATLESIHWSNSNPQFAPGQGLVLYPQIGDKMDIVCPRSDASSGGQEEFYRVYLVSRSQMESCAVDKMDTPLLNCDKPHRDVKFTFKFQEFSPNLWGLEFLKGKDYYITSTSTGSLRGLDNTNGGACRTQSMKVVLRVGQNSSDPVSTLQESPTRFPPKRPKSKAKDTAVTEHDGGQTNPSDSETRRLVWILSACALVLLLVVAALVLLWRHRRRRCAAGSQRSASVSLNTLAVPKRDSVSSDNNGSDRSDVVFPLRPSDGMICRHYERVSSGDYGAPVYIVQEVTPTSAPTNIYYKV